MRLTAGTRRGSFAPALAMPYPALENAGLRLRRGQMSLWTAASGVGKSQLMANIAHRGGFPTLYWSADTDQHDVTIRSLALWLGMECGEVEKIRENPAWDPFLAEALGKASHIDWEFDSRITPRKLGERMNAYCEVRGEYPHLVVVDNLSNTVDDMDNEFSEQKQVMVALQLLARESTAHIAVLHHAKGEYEGGTRPIPKNGVLNNLLKLPEVGVTIHRSGDNRIGVNVVKNRGGRDDPAAKNVISLSTDFSRATVLGHTA